MAFFNFGKKKEEKKASECCCSCAPAAEESHSCCCGTEETSCCCSGQDICCGRPVDGICCIKVLGAGCKACHAQYEYVLAAVKNLGLNVPVEHITDMEIIVNYGVMAMPAIVVNEKVVSVGKTLKTADVEKLLKK